MLTKGESWQIYGAQQKKLNDNQLQGQIEGFGPREIIFEWATI